MLHANDCVEKSLPYFDILKGMKPFSFIHSFFFNYFFWRKRTCCQDNLIMNISRSIAVSCNAILVNLIFVVIFMYVCNKKKLGSNISFQVMKQAHYGSASGCQVTSLGQFDTKWKHTNERKFWQARKDGHTSARQVISLVVSFQKSRRNSFPQP